MAEESNSLEYTPTWIVAAVCSIIVFISLLAERGLHRLGKFLKRKEQDALFEALQKLKEELMLLGFISLLLTVSQGLISRLCIPAHLAIQMLPCNLKTASHRAAGHHSDEITSHGGGRRLLSAAASSNHCSTHRGMVPLFSLEALHQLHIFIFVLAVVHVIFCATTMVLGGAKVREWKHWEDGIKRGNAGHAAAIQAHHHAFRERAGRHWRKAAVISWVIAFFKQFYGSVTKSDYIALRSGFIRVHCPGSPNYDFHKYLLRTLETDFKKIVGISWYLWLFVVIFLLLNIEGWHTYFWLSFLPLILLLLLGAKLEHIITIMAKESAERKQGDPESTTPVKPSDELFWFHRPAIVLYLIHFILFQNAFEIGFFFWILCTYGFESCIMEKVGYIVPRLVMGVIVQVLCSYSTLPLYALVSQMGSMFKPTVFDEVTREHLLQWVRGRRSNAPSSTSGGDQTNRMVKESSGSVCIAQGIVGSTIELTQS